MLCFCWLLRVVVQSRVPSLVVLMLVLPGYRVVVVFDIGSLLREIWWWC